MHWDDMEVSRDLRCALKGFCADFIYGSLW